MKKIIAINKDKETIFDKEYIDGFDVDQTILEFIDEVNEYIEDEMLEDEIARIIIREEDDDYIDTIHSYSIEEIKEIKEFRNETNG